MCLSDDMPPGGEVVYKEEIVSKNKQRPYTVMNKLVLSLVPGWYALALTVCGVHWARFTLHTNKCIYSVCVPRKQGYLCTLCLLHLQDPYAK